MKSHNSRAMALFGAALAFSLIAALAACVPERPQWHPSAVYANPQRAVLREDQAQSVQPCLVGTSRCLGVDPHSWRPCLISTERCSAEGKIEPIDAGPH